MSIYLPKEPLKVGDIVIIFRHKHPIQHNSSPESISELGGDGLRAEVLSIGRVYAHLSTRGTPWKVRLDGNSRLGDFALPVEEAKEFHRKMNFADDPRPKEVIDDIIGKM